MGWWIAIAKAGRGAAQSSRFSRLGSLSARISAWLQSTKWSSWLKVGAAGGAGFAVYHGWRSLIGTVSDATGLSEGSVETILFLGIGAAVAYVAARLLLPDRSDGTTVVIPAAPDRHRRFIDASYVEDGHGTNGRANAHGGDQKDVRSSEDYWRRYL